MIKVSKESPCPICGKADWCGVAEKGKFAICMRVQSKKPSKNGGWIHALDLDDAKKYKYRNTKPKKRPKVRDMFLAHQGFDKRCSDTLVTMLANDLGVTEESLKRLSIGYDGQNYTFPMRDAHDKIIGIKKRASNGSKFCENGSQLGIYWPIGIDSKAGSTLYITEGESDTAAILSMDLQAIGRPSCRGGVEIIKEFLSGSWRDVIIVGDKEKPMKKCKSCSMPRKWAFDECPRCGASEYTRLRPGIDGAESLAEAIDGSTRSLRVIHPPGNKDIRQWYKGGATCYTLAVITNNTGFWKKQ